MLLGKLDKMKIHAYTRPDFSPPDGSPLSVLINPESYTIQYRVDYNDEQAQGTSQPSVKFNNIPAQDIYFDFVFDSSGVVVEPSLINIGIVNPFAETANVIDQIEAFKAKVLNYNGDIHSPQYISLNWGTLLFKGRMTSMDIEFKVFKPDGTPIRAVAKCSFRGHIEEDLRVALENSQSPDITHQHLFSADDRFALLTEKMYDTPDRYLEVARENRLLSFRKIPTGTKLFFPPVEK
ncbi:CIS tube protein [Foetidibacter luteolus]|uniref:CIS tube protein n=1 Tax=Foetidibacter luteolus TaxID=2608880 RepID=UPI00129B6A1E|nr:LysM peptidoglycan-binding domain-containing protein [Foetidibacter luteolus]